MFFNVKNKKLWYIFFATNKLQFPDWVYFPTGCKSHRTHWAWLGGIPKPTVKSENSYCVLSKTLILKFIN